VRAQQERRRVGRGRWEAREQVAGVGADTRAGVVDLDAGAHARQDLVQPRGDGPLALRDAADLHQREELVAQA